MSLFLICLLFIALAAVNWSPALVQPETVGQAPNKSIKDAAPRDKGSRTGQSIDARTDVDWVGSAVLPTRIEYWQASDGLHIVEIHADGRVEQKGWLWV